MRRLLQRKLCRRKTLLFTLFLLSLTIGITPLSAKEVTVTFTMKDYFTADTDNVYSLTLSEDFSATFTKGGTNPPRYMVSASSSTPNTLRIYKNGGTATITTSNDNYTIKSIVGAKNQTETKKYDFTIAADKKSGKFTATETTYFHHFNITYDDGTSSGPQDFDSAHDQFTGLTWNDTSSAYDLTMTYGDTFTLSPKSSTPPTITYAIADGAATDVVSIDGNKLTAMKAGTTTITASWSADDNWNADTRTIKVTVNPAPVCGDITFSPAAGEVARGTEVTLSCENATEITYTVTPTGGTASEPTTVNANTAKVTINEACTISATAKNKEGVATTTFTAKYTITAAPICGDITFSPADGSVVEAGSKVTISCENAAKITYTVTKGGVAEDPVVVTGSSATVTINAACTITAKAENADGVATEEFSASYTLPVIKDYTLFTDYGDNSVPDGDYIFVGKVTKGDKTYYMEGQNGEDGYRTATEVTPNDGVISVKESFEIHIQKESNSNYSLITKDGKYLYDDKAKLKEGTDTKWKGIWTPSFNKDGNLVFKTGSNSLCFNASSPRFRTYSSIQAYFSLYAPKSDALGNIKFSPASGSTVDKGTEITISAQNATSLAYSIKTGDVWSESVMITGNSVNVPVTEDCTISVIAKNDETHEQKSAEATYTVAHPVTYELVEKYNGNDIPDGNYIFASSKDDGSSFAIMGNKIDDYREAIPVTPTGNKFDAYSRYTIKVQKEGNGNYSLITSEGKYLYSNSSQNLNEGDNSYAGKWKPDVTGSTVLFTYIDADADVDAVIKYNISTTPTRFKAYKASTTNGMRPISLYTSTPKPAMVVCTDATITNEEIHIAVKKTITFKSEGAGKMACQVLDSSNVETFDIVDGDTYTFTAASEPTEQFITIIPYDKYGVAYKPSELVVSVHTHDLPKISYHFVDGEDKEDKAAFYAENGTITEIRPYLIDGTLEAEALDLINTYPDNVIPFRFSQPRFKVTASNEYGDTVEDFSFIQELCNRKNIESGAYTVAINYKDANSTAVASFPIAETELGSLKWTMDGYLVNESDDILKTYPFLIKESYITLHIAPYGADGPTILNVKIAAPADGGEGVYGAPAHAPATDDLVATKGNFNFVQNGGSHFYFDGQGKNFIKGNIEVSPFEYANISITSIDDVTTEVSDILDEDAEEVFYNLQGVRVENPDKGIYIRVKGNKTEKILK